MYPETKPIILDCPKQFDRIEIYPIHDLHYGNECYDAHKYNVLRGMMEEAPDDKTRQEFQRFISKMEQMQ
jgi:hypothetical protein